MKAHAIETHMKKAHVIEQLNLLGYYDTEGKTYDELKRKLAVARALQIKPDGHLGWF